MRKIILCLFVVFFSMANAQSNANIVVEQGGNLIVRNNGQILLVDGESFYIPQGANLSLINGVIQ